MGHHVSSIEAQMTLDELAAVFFKFACPFLLVVTPLGLILMYRAPNPPEDHLGPGTYAIVTIVGLVITGLSFRYCRNEMGWFGGKRKDKDPF